MAWALSTSGAAIAKSGADANSAIVASAATLATWSDEVESIISDIARYDVATNYSSFTAVGKIIFGAIHSAMIAQRIISYDILSYGSARTAETMLDVLENDIVRNINMIEGDKVKAYLAVSSG